MLLHIFFLLNHKNSLENTDHVKTITILSLLTGELIRGRCHVHQRCTFSFRQIWFAEMFYVSYKCCFLHLFAYFFCLLSRKIEFICKRNKYYLGCQISLFLNHINLLNHDRYLIVFYFYFIFQL